MKIADREDSVEKLGLWPYVIVSLVVMILVRLVWFTGDHGAINPPIPWAPIIIVGLVIGVVVWALDRFLIESDK